MRLLLTSSPVHGRVVLDEGVRLQGRRRGGGPGAAHYAEAAGQRVPRGGGRGALGAEGGEGVQRAGPRQRRHGGGRSSTGAQVGVVALRVSSVKVCYVMWCLSAMTLIGHAGRWCLGSGGLVQLPIPLSPGCTPLLA